MIADKNRIYDGWINLEAGVDAGRAPQMLLPNQAVSGTNVTFRGGDLTTRPGFRKLDEQFPENIFAQRFCYGKEHFGIPVGVYTPLNTVPGPIPSWFENQNSEFVYKNGILQCAHAFSPHKAEDCIMAVIGGRLFKIVPGINTAKVDEIIPDDPPYGLLSKPYSFRNRSFTPLAYMAQADKWLIVQDGDSRPIIYDGRIARRSKVTANREQTEIPVGTMMAYGMGRICVVVNDRDVAFGDLYGSHDLPDPADSIIFFTERNFLTEGFDAAIPFQQGVATGISFFPQLDTSTGNGQLMVFAERGAASFFLSLPRELWKTSQFQILALLTTGMRGHRSIATVNEDLWFRSDDGMRSFRQARSESTGWAHIPLSTNVRQFMENDSPWLLKYASSIYFDNRILTTVSPAWNQGRTFHMGIAVVDFDILSSFGTESKPAWEGIWRFPKGIRVIQLLTGQFNGITRAFAFCQDENLQNQLYEITKDDVNDWDDQLIEWDMVSRSMDFSKLSQDSTPFNEVELYDADIWMTGIAE